MKRQVCVTIPGSDVENELEKGESEGKGWYEASRVILLSKGRW